MRQRTTQGVWKDEVHKDAFGVGNRVSLKSLSRMDDLGEINLRYRVGGESG